MMIGARSKWAEGFVGSFHPYIVARRLIDAFPEVMICMEDSFLGYREKAIAEAADFLQTNGDYPHPVLESKIRKITNYSPRYIFKMWTGERYAASGSIDRYNVHITFEAEEEFPQDFQDRFRAFLGSLKFGEPMIWDDIATSDQ